MPKARTEAASLAAFEAKLERARQAVVGGVAANPDALQARAETVLKGANGFSHVVNGRFKGGWITRHYGRPGEGVHALQLEVAQRCYMDEAPPYPWDPARAAALVAVLRALVAALAGWRPPR